MDTIICGNSLELITKIPDKSVNLIVTSPPYFQQRFYTGNPLEIGRENDVDIYLDNLILLFQQCLRILHDDGNLVWNLGDKYISGNLQLIPYQFALRASKYATLNNCCMWVKSNPTPSQNKRRLVNSYEPFFHFVKSKNYYFCPLEEKIDNKIKKIKSSRYFALIDNSLLTENEKNNAKEDLRKVIDEVNTGKLHSFRLKIRGIHAMPYGGQEGGRKNQILNNGYTIIRIYGRKLQKDVFEFPVDNIKWKNHPAVYPKQLVAKFIKMLSKEGDLVFDPFMGSGTTAIACKELGRKYLGFELCEEFVKESLKRLGLPDNTLNVING